MNEAGNSPSSRKRNRNNRIGKIARATALALLVAAVGWLLFAPDTLEMEVARVAQGPLQITIDNQGQVRVRDRYVVSAPVAAELQRVQVHEGDRVERNRLLVTLKPLPMDMRQKEEATARLDAAKAQVSEADMQVRHAQAQHELALSEMERVRRLVENNFISPQAAEKTRTAEIASRADLAAARSRQQAAIANMHAARAALIAADTTSGTAGPAGNRELTLTSPVDGYVIKVHERSVRTLPAGSPLITIGDPSRYEVVVDVLSSDAVKIAPGQTMLLEGWGGGQTLTAKVRLVEPVAFTKVSVLGVEEQRVNVLADPVDPLGALGDGYRVEARVIIWSSEQVTKVPSSSLFRAGQAWHVFVLEEGRARRRQVEVGQRNQNEAQVLSGVQAGDTIIRFPSNDLEDGRRIKAVAADAGN